MIIGITGGIASGKTYICNYLKSKNYSVFEADKEIANLGQNQLIINKIKEKFPEFSSGPINKEILRAICLNDYRRLRTLQEIYYPFLEIEVENFLANHKNEELIFLEAPLFFEAGYNKFVEKIITIVADKSIKELRAIKRGTKKSDFEKFLAAQINDEERVKKSDYIIYSNNLINNVEIQIDNLINSLKNERNSS